MTSLITSTTVPMLTYSFIRSLCLARRGKKWNSGVFWFCFYLSSNNYVAQNIKETKKQQKSGGQNSTARVKDLIVHNKDLRKSKLMVLTVKE